MPRINLFADTVLRKGPEGILYLMNHPEKGWSSHAEPIKSVQHLLDKYNVRLGEWTSDKFGEYCPVIRVKTYTVDYDDGRNKFVLEFPMPDRLAQPGDVYEFTETARTLANQSYKKGDRLEIIERTQDRPHHRLSSLGNRLKKDYPHLTIFVQSVLEPRFGAKLVKLGFVEQPTDPHCFYLLPEKELIV